MVLSVLNAQLQSAQAEAIHCVAIHADNSSDWLVVDQWASEQGLVIVPIPHFFSYLQIQRLVAQAAVDCVFCAPHVVGLWQQMGFQQQTPMVSLVRLTRVAKKMVNVPLGTHKITFTSGSTEAPKGVCLSQKHLQIVGQSLAQAIADLQLKRHLSLLPYSVLLENVAVAYANTTAIEIISPPLAEVGLTGSGEFDVTQMVSALEYYRPDSIIMVPAMLKALLAYLMQLPKNLSFLKFMAVGGAVCPPELIRQAHALSLPVYEGYGISECGSVICLNTRLSHSGSVGKPLAHARIELDAQGQLIYYGPRFLGYLGECMATSETDILSDELGYATGDLGAQDNEGRISLHGRLSHVIINGFGRNISPEWLEAELLALPAIEQVMVVGNGEAFLTALCVSKQSVAALKQLVIPINKKLPDYARIHEILKVPAFTEANHSLTATGKLIRTTILSNHQFQLEQFYANGSNQQ